MNIIKYLLKITSIATIVVIANIHGAYAQEATPSASPTVNATPTPILNIPILPSLLPSSSPVQSPVPSNAPSTSPIASVSAVPTASISATPLPSFDPSIATAAGGLISESASPTPSPTISPSPSPTSSPGIITKVSGQSKNQAPNTVASISKSVNTAIKSPVEAITRALNTNPYQAKSLSSRTSLGLTTMALILLISGILLIKPELLGRKNLRFRQKIDLLRNRIQSNL